VQPGQHRRTTPPGRPRTSAEGHRLCPSVRPTPAVRATAERRTRPVGPEAQPSTTRRCSLKKEERGPVPSVNRSPTPFSVLFWFFSVFFGSDSFFGGLQLPVLAALSIVRD